MDAAFGGEVDYAQLVKLYGPSPEGEPLFASQMHGDHQDARLWRSRLGARQHVLPG
jgi:hypothetical protein